MYVYHYYYSFSPIYHLLWLPRVWFDLACVALFRLMNFILKLYHSYYNLVKTVWECIGKQMKKIRGSSWFKFFLLFTFYYRIKDSSYLNLIWFDLSFLARGFSFWGFGIYLPLAYPYFSSTVVVILVLDIVAYISPWNFVSLSQITKTLLLCNKWSWAQLIQLLSFVHWFLKYAPLDLERSKKCKSWMEGGVCLDGIVQDSKLTPFIHTD